jgi:hypothetical protein
MITCSAATSSKHRLAVGRHDSECVEFAAERSDHPEVALVGGEDLVGVVAVGQNRVEGVGDPDFREHRREARFLKGSGRGHGRPPPAIMESMPQTPGEQALNAVTARVTAHIAGGWPRLGPSEVRFRGRYCYVAVALPGHRQPTPFLRLRWQGSPDEWAIGIYKATTEQYSENEFPWVLRAAHREARAGNRRDPCSLRRAADREVITPSRQPRNCESRVILKRS